MGGHYDVEIKRVDQWEDIMMYKDSGWTKEGIMMGGHYDVDMKSWMQKGPL